MHFTVTGALIGLVFGIFGFFLGFSLKRAASIVLLAIFAFATLKALEYLGVAMNWRLFESLVHALAQLGKTSIELIRGMLTAATLLSIILFLCGGVLGVITRR
jgi:uncharacterized membrane protein (Fun14 family)